jgi:hypothetical protein
VVRLKHEEADLLSTGAIICLYVLFTVLVGLGEAFGSDAVTISG